MEQQQRQFQSLKTILPAILERIDQQEESVDGKPPKSCDQGCFDGWIIVEGRGARPCRCQVAARRRKSLDRIPPRYRGLDLETIEPRCELHDKQADVLARIKAKPDGSYILYGKNETGKTMVGWLLYRAAIEAGRPAIGLLLSELLDQFKAWEVDPEKLPIVDSETLRSDKQRWFLFLDEFEKANVSAFTCRKLFQLLDAAYSYHHQLVITSNVSKDQLEAVWSRQDPVWGTSIMRRVLQADGMMEIELFD